MPAPSEKESGAILTVLIHFSWICVFSLLLFLVVYRTALERDAQEHTVAFRLGPSATHSSRLQTPSHAL